MGSGVLKILHRLGGNLKVPRRRLRKKDHGKALAFKAQLTVNSSKVEVATRRWRHPHLGGLACPRQRTNTKVLLLLVFGRCVAEQATLAALRENAWVRFQ